jgi:hypothetical protein
VAVRVLLALVLVFYLIALLSGAVPFLLFPHK